MSESGRIVLIAFDVVFGALSLAGGCWIILAMGRRFRGRDSSFDRFLLGEHKRQPSR